VELHHALLCFREITGLCLEPHEQAHRLTYISLLSTLILSLLVPCRLYKASRGPTMSQMNSTDTLRYISLLSTLILSLLIYSLYKNSRGPVMSQMNPADTLRYISLLSTLILSLLIYRLYKNSQGPIMSQMNPAHKHNFPPSRCHSYPPFLTPTNSFLASDLSFDIYLHACYIS
jgi:hypothetical protein